MPSDNIYEGLSVDPHSHMLHGLDDGAESIDQSLQMLDGMKKLGFKKIIATPHVMMDSYRNNPVIINDKLTELRDASKEAGIEIEIEAAAEYFLDDGFEEIIKDGRLLTFGNKYILIELSPFIPHPNFKEIMFNMQIDGYRIILAHAERYSYWYRNFQAYEELKNRDILFQVNTLSFGGFYNQDYKKIAEKLVKLDMVDFLGTDMHRPAQLMALKKCRNLPVVDGLIKGGRLLNSSL